MSENRARGQSGDLGFRKRIELVLLEKLKSTRSCLCLQLSLSQIFLEHLLCARHQTGYCRITDGEPGSLSSRIIWLFFPPFNKWYLYACTKLDLDFRSGQKTVQELLGTQLSLSSCYWTEHRMCWESRCYNTITGFIKGNQSRVSLCGWYCTSADLIIITQPSGAIRAVNDFLASCTVLQKVSN